MRTDEDQARIERESADRIKALVTLFGMLSDGEREEAISALRERWCLACGTAEYGRSCQCQNDE